MVGSRVGDSPWYTRLGYSTATAPLASPAAWASPVDQSVVLLDALGRATHRAGMRTLRLELLGEGSGRVAVGASVARAHWVDPAPGQRDHGSGKEGAACDAAAVTTVSVVRGPWEVRCVRVDELPGAPRALAAAQRLRLGGWPQTGDAVTSVLAPVEGFDETGVHAEDDASPLAHHTATPWAAGPVVPGQWCVAVVGLSGAGDQQLPRVTVGGDVVRIDWLDGEAVTVPLTGAPADDDQTPGRR